LNASMKRGTIRCRTTSGDFSARNFPAASGAVQDPVHELRVLIELRPCLVRFLNGHRDVRPALDRQAPCLLPAAFTTAATTCGLRQRLARDSAESTFAR